MFTVFLSNDTAPTEIFTLPLHDALPISCSNLFAAAGTKTVTNASVPDSNAVQFNQAGTFYWQAVYSSDAKHWEGTSFSSSHTQVSSAGSHSKSITYSATYVALCFRYAHR